MLTAVRDTIITRRLYQIYEVKLVQTSLVVIKFVIQGFNL